MCVVYIFIIYLIFQVCVSLHIYPYAICVQEPMEIRRDIGSPGTGVIGIVSCQVNGGN